jgi:uncharacterized BrkB/YihY/UPF0761 family membrane protein
MSKETIVVIGCFKMEWKLNFVEVERLWDIDKVDRQTIMRKKEIMCILLIIMGGILILILILTLAAYMITLFLL